MAANMILGTPDPTTVLIAQEITFAQALSDNDKHFRDKALKKLKMWLPAKSKSGVAFTKDDFLRIGKGLFYFMWMSDKLLVQEEAAESISSLIHCFESAFESMLFVKSFFKVICMEWVGLDQYRVDKFSMLIRRFLRQSLKCCENTKWDPECIKLLVSAFEETVLHESTPLGVTFHFITVFPEELAKVGGDSLADTNVVLLVEPFIKILAVTKNGGLRDHSFKLFRELIRQTDLGLEYEVRFDAWKQLGFPGGNINCMRKQRDASEEQSPENTINEEEEQEDDLSKPKERHLDPRAGKVDVFLPQIKINPTLFVNTIEKCREDHARLLKGKKCLSRLQRQFQIMEEGNYPLANKGFQVLNFKKKDPFTNTFQGVKRLEKLERKLKAVEIKEKRKLKLIGSLNREITEKSENKIKIGKNKLKRKNLSDKLSLDAKKKKMQGTENDSTANESAVAINKKKKLPTQNDDNMLSEDVLVKKKKKMRAKENDGTANESAVATNKKKNLPTQNDDNMLSDGVLVKKKKMQEDDSKSDDVAVFKNKVQPKRIKTPSGVDLKKEKSIDGVNNILEGAVVQKNEKIKDVNNASEVAVQNKNTIDVINVTGVAVQNKKETMNYYGISVAAFQKEKKAALKNLKKMAIANKKKNSVNNANGGVALQKKKMKNGVNCDNEVAVQQMNGINNSNVAAVLNKNKAMDSVNNASEVPVPKKINPTKSQETGNSSKRTKVETEKKKVNIETPGAESGPSSAPEVTSEPENHPSFNTPPNEKKHCDRIQKARITTCTKLRVQPRLNTTVKSLQEHPFWKKTLEKAFTKKRSSFAPSLSSKPPPSKLLEEEPYHASTAISFSTKQESINIADIDKAVESSCFRFDPSVKPTRSSLKSEPKPKPRPERAFPDMPI